jgi:transcriptional regulator with GAF, ATPase, and Fis domain
MKKRLAQRPHQAVVSGAPLPASDQDVASPSLTDFLALVDSSPRMQALRDVVREVARTDATVLVRGESGVGKNLIARAIHAASVRRAGPFELVNCAALPGELLESELFGHEKGAFTGAYRRKPGRFEFAGSGTLCLDEIGEMSAGLQAKLLHVLQDLHFTRVGGRESIRADVRIIATTNRDLEVAMHEGQFREDLYYRLNVFEVHVPPLRERVEAIPALVETFLARFNHQYGRQVDLPTETVQLMGTYDWPGNIRELENFVRRLVVLGDPRRAHQELTERLRTLSRPSSPPAASSAPAPVLPVSPVPPGAPLADMFDLKAIARRAAREAERKALLEVLERVRWNRTAAARILKVSYKTLLSKLTECGITPSKTGPS